MRLSDLLPFNNIVIQCHDNPDADALASGMALHWYFSKHGKQVRFIYRGNNKVQKSNLVIMLTELSIPVSYEPGFDGFDEEPDLLITVDCQYGSEKYCHHRSPSAYCRPA